jgi:alkylation response protein AidB-like acyl-CoA dehydrogenase
MIEPGGDLDDLRMSVRTWCAENVPGDWRQTLRGADEVTVNGWLRGWTRTLQEGGLIAPHLPREWGGGFSIHEQVVISEEMARGDAPRNGLYYVALYNVTPTLLHNATPEQIERWVGGIMRDGDVWCQGFSEPDSGSDLASLQTRAVRDGDHYVINGQKVWTSRANHADRCMILVRTDPEAPKHKGISCLVMDMDTPGIDARPIRQATGVAGFCELFLDDVVVPVENLVGAENNGWAVAQGTLAAERAIAILDLTERLRRNGIEAALRDAAGWVLDDGTPALDDPTVRDHFAASSAEVAALRALLNALIENVIRGGDVGGTSSIIKVFYTEVLERFMRGLTEIRGLAGQAAEPLLDIAGWESGYWMIDYIGATGWHTGGGTSEIMRNVIAERSLGLPR